MSNSTNIDLVKVKNIALEACNIAGKEIVTAFFTPKKITTKGEETNFVTETDTKVELILIDYLKQHVDASWQFITEETKNDEPLTDVPTWIIGTKNINFNIIADPIDGTTNFIHRIPFISISIGLCINKTPVLGVTHNPITPNETYWAITGKGAHRIMADNTEQTITVSQAQDLTQAVVCGNYGYDKSDKHLKQLHEKHTALLQHPVHGMRVMGSAVVSMTSVANGSMECYFENGIQVWDIAAGCVLVAEAGGVVRDPSGGPVNIMSRRILVANNDTVAQQVATILNTVEAKQ